MSMYVWLMRRSGGGGVCVLDRVHMFDSKGRVMRAIFQFIEELRNGKSSEVERRGEGRNAGSH
jgi:hypothetical protein